MSVEQSDGQQQATTGPAAVELFYRPGQADAVGAVRARNTAVTSQARRFADAVVALVLVGAGALLLRSGEYGPAGAGLIVAGLAVALLIPLQPWLVGRQLNSMLEKYGETRAVVDTTGVRFAATGIDQSFTWQSWPRYKETPELFVLLSADRKSLGVALLPKRGILGEDGEARLRAVLDECSLRT
ncbi:hypothetical protein [Streptomyces qinzhouensis]|uniref:YcxB family protein n=1 Tax=Streptomyces qinzhouensis TaxID=2599401 RepID=A0A5B8JGR5_9ACTN|nr:hypothetical protein [Streptomyces qinzhouensis]QDY76653.1 hypothetical protein FQU76_09040 [Streptomyces qinzhouensis]